MQPAKGWKTPSWKIDILEHDIIQHTQIATDNFLLFLSNRETIDCSMNDSFKNTHRS